MNWKFRAVLFLLLSSGFLLQAKPARERVLLNEGWKFHRYGPDEKPDNLQYDVRPEVTDQRDDKPADAQPTAAEAFHATVNVLKPWILPTGNAFSHIRYERPAGHPGSDFPFVQYGFDDSGWKSVSLPHDWAIEGPFYEGNNVPVGGGMGRLPVQGVAWYRRTLDIPASDRGRSFFLDVDGAMSYAMVWINGKLAGGWPYGYSSFRVDLTPYIVPGGKNQLAIRLDNPANSSRWYPGAGLYRNVWLVRTEPVRVRQWGAQITTKEVSAGKATVQLKVVPENAGKTSCKVTVRTEVFIQNPLPGETKAAVLRFPERTLNLTAGSSDTVSTEMELKNPLLWGPTPNQKPRMYLAVTTLFVGGRQTDRYETPFGIRDLRFDPNKGLFVNGEKVAIKGTNQHHDLGALGAAFNRRAALRQLEMLQEMGCNAIRMSHNPPDPQLLELTDSLGMLVLDELFDCWQRKKTPLDFHLIFDDWSEQDLRAMVRRDFNHPSVVIWSFGNEVGEQYTDAEGAKVAARLSRILKEEDSSRPSIVAMNYAKPDMPLPGVPDLVGLNYQGEGIRNGGPYAGLRGITTPPLFPAFHAKYPDKMIVSTENASALSSRGTYLFPVFPGNSAPIRDGQGGNSKAHEVSSYELYSVDFGSSADKVFATLDQHPYVSGGFVWTGWDYLGEPTPYYSARSSYSGIIDLAGFKKDRYYLYQAYWRPDFPMAHLLPHWTWPERTGLVTPVHVVTSGDEAELFLNGRSLGRKQRKPLEYRLRWDSVCYEPGEIRVVAYKGGVVWAADTIRTAGEPYALQLQADRTVLDNTGRDVSFVTVRITDRNGNTVPRTSNLLRFSVDGPADFVAADNGDAADLTAFPSTTRKAYGGLCMLIVQARKGATGTIRVKVSSEGLVQGSLQLINTRNQ
jgi:beta-galactosidase